MSMDEQFTHMTTFLQTLDQFNQTLHASWQDVETQYDQLTPGWNDEFRQRHDANWERLAQNIRIYLNREGPHYLEVLAQKQNALQRYLRGV